MSKKSGKRILSVTIRRMVDDSPDTSYLGEHSNRAETEYAIDRAHAQDCIENDSIQKEKLGRIANAIENDRPICEEHPHEFSKDCETCQEELVYTRALEQVQELTECDCGEHGDMGRNEFRYFNGPVENYLGESPEDIRKYVRQDYERMESLNAGNWCFLGIRADAEVTLTENAGSSVIQRISSGGLWGIESDSDQSYFDEVRRDELSALKTELLALGLSKRAIATAFKSVEEKDE